jgi:RNA polymerase sigma factor (sigma-70 family)
MRTYNQVHKPEANSFARKKYFILTVVKDFIAHICATNFFLTAPKTYTESELLAGLRQYNQAAFQYLYLNYRGALYNIILQLIPDKETAADVLQEVFTTIWKQIDKYDETKGKLFTWMLRLARNSAINKLRSKTYKSQAKNEDLTNYVTVIEKNQPEAELINRIGLRKQVHLLREDYKNVIELSYYSGFTQEEISTALNIPLGTVKTRLRNALLELRKQFV